MIGTLGRDSFRNQISGAQKDRLEELMTRKQIAEAQRLSREWLEAHPPGN
jgi:hypothetical protein